MTLAAATQFLRRWRSLLALSVLAGLFVSWAWSLLGAALLLTAELIRSWTAKREMSKVEQTRLAYVGELAASPSGLTYTRSGKSTYVRWDEIVSVAYAQDPFSQENEWWLRRLPGAPGRPAVSIPDYAEIRAPLMTYLEGHLPGFSSKVYDDVVVKAFSQDNDAVVECWARNNVANSPAA